MGRIQVYTGPLHVISPTTQTGLVDAHGRPVYEGGLTVDEIVDAATAAASVDNFDLAREIMRRHNLNLCLICRRPVEGDGLGNGTLCSWTCMDKFIQQNALLSRP